MKIFIILVSRARRPLKSKEWAQTHIYNMTTIIVLTSLIITSSAITILASTPLNLGISILFIALILATIYSSIISSWIAFLIFLIYVRGILVIFTYFVALSPNLKTNNLTIYTAPILFIIVLSSNLFYTLPQTSTSYKSIINVFYLKNNIPILLILALILLFTIIVVVKLVNTNKGPLRPFL